MGRHRTSVTLVFMAVFCLLGPARADEDPDLKKALDDLTAKGSVRRLAAVKTLRGAGWADRDVMRLALRIVKWDEDTGLLADLLARHPEAMLPPLLHRIVHSASLHRAQICRALGRTRVENEASVAVLIVRALLDPDEKVRVMARLALEAAAPHAVAIVRAHDELYERIADGSTAYVSSGLVLGPGGARHSRYGRFLRMTMRAEAGRFGADTVLRVYRFFVELGEDTEHAKEIEPYFQVTDGNEVRKAALVLAQLGRSDLTHLRKLADRPAFLGAVGRAVGLIGPTAQSLGPRLFRALRDSIEHPVAEPGRDLRIAPGGNEDWSEYERYVPTADVLWGILRARARHQEIQHGLVELLETDLLWIDRSMIEACLRVMRPNGKARDRLIERAMRFDVSALRVVPWCERPLSPLHFWLEEQRKEKVKGRLTRTKRMQLRHLQRQLDMPPDESDAIVRALRDDLERWSAELEGP